MTDVRKQREKIGILICLTTCTRPDLSFAVSKLAQYFAEPTEEHWSTVEYVLRYLKGILNKELTYRKCENEKLGIHAHSDTDQVTDRQSTTGYCVNLSENGPLIS